MREHLDYVNMKEQEIIHTAIENIPDDIGLNMTWENDPVNQANGRVRITIDGMEILFQAEIKKELREHQLPNIELNAKQYPPFMLIAHYLRPAIKKKLRENNIAYMEKNGNIFFRQNGKLLFVDANKPIKLAEETGNRAFTVTGLKVVFQFLLDDELVNRPYREIADFTKTALGNVNNIMKGLEKDGFLIRLSRDKKRIQNKKNLLEKWIADYQETLQPTLKIGRFRFASENKLTDWKEIQLDNETTWWGGEPAGDILTNYLRPGELTLYTTRTRNELMKDLRLIPDPNGDVIAFTAFWNVEKQENKQHVHPLLVYTDLMNTTDNRCHETAQLIWNKYLKNEF
jgi:hypothetical protein